MSGTDVSNRKNGTVDSPGVSRVRTPLSYTTPIGSWSEAETFSSLLRVSMVGDTDRVSFEINRYVGDHWHIEVHVHGDNRSEWQGAKAWLEDFVGIRSEKKDSGDHTWLRYEWVSHPNCRVVVMLHETSVQGD